jgi:hypothetical protein
MDNQTIIRLLLIILAALVLFALVSYYNRNKSRLEAENFRASPPSASDVGLTPDAYAAAMPRASSSSSKAKSSKSSVDGASSYGGGVENYSDAPRPVMENDPSPSMNPFSTKRNSDGEFDVMPVDPLSTEQNLAVDYGTNKMTGINDCFPSDSVQSVEKLLPKDAANTKWSQVNPAGQGDVKDQNFLSAGHHIGTNTVGTSLRNASLDIRGDPLPNPRVVVSPWMQSTIDPNITQKGLDGFS